MRISMSTDFYILKNVGNGVFVPVDDKDIEDVSIGGYEFHVGDMSVPFDWEAYEGGWDRNGFYSFSTGRGWFFNNFELDTCYDEHYAEIGLKRENVTAAFLASAHHIEEFYINFVGKDGKECEAGDWKANGDADAPYRLMLLQVSFEDVDAEKTYPVDPKVIDAFNKGEKLLGLNSVLDSAQSRGQKAPANEIGKNDLSIEGFSL